MRQDKREASTTVLEPTSLGRFGDNSMTHVGPGASVLFGLVRARVQVAEDAIALGAVTDTLFEPARVWLVVATTSDATRMTGEDAGNPFFVTIVWGDRDPGGQEANLPARGPWGGEVQELEFEQLFVALCEILTGQHTFRYRCSLSADSDEAQLEFPLPMNLWRSNRPLGTMVGARFKLEARGARDGWIALDVDDGALQASLEFTRDSVLDHSTIEDSWKLIRRLYDKVIVTTQ